VAALSRSRLAIIISGSRDLYTVQHRAVIRTYLEDRALTVLRDTGLRSEHTVVLHGAQRGADAIADEEARALHLASWGVPYFNELDEPLKGFYTGGPRRNECVVDLACVLRDTGLYEVVMGAFPSAKSRGTHQAVEYANKRGITVDMRPQ
jgi:hypothetical protein